MIAPVEALPANAKKTHRQVLAEGEVTGHSHRIAEPGSASLYDCGGDLYLEVFDGGASVRHEEHRTIELQPGLFRVWRQREYFPAGNRTVRD